MDYIAVCDDNQDDAKLLIKCIDEYAMHEGKKLECHYYNDGSVLLDSFEKGENKYCLIFLDIFMKGLDGISTAREIRRLDGTVPLVFLSASNEYASESYEVGASGYLLKPLDDDKAVACLDKCLNKSSDRQLVLRLRGQYHYISFDEIKYVESCGHEIRIHLTDDVVTFTGKLSEIEGKLGDERFLRCHQSYLVNMDYVYKVDNTFILKDKSKVPIRIRQKRSIADTYYKYYLNKVSLHMPIN